MENISQSSNAFFSDSSSDSAFADFHFQSNQMSSSRPVKRFMGKTPYIPFFIVLVVIVIIVTIVFRNAASKPPTTVLSASSTNANTTINRVTIEKPRASETLNKTFQFVLRDDKGKALNKIKYQIQTVESRDQIIIKGQKATAVKGRTFLVVNLKLTNSSEKLVQLNARDYIRVMINGSDEKLAPEIYSDPLEVQAISTKYTSLGFPINETDKNIVLQVGEIAGKKEYITLHLK
jgi:hypothetical protein